MNARTTPAVSRRAVVYAAAWGAPVVVVATAAPAMAASGPAALSVPAATTTAVAQNSNPDTITILSTINNANNQASTLLTVTLDITLGNANQWGALTTPPTVTAAGYTSVLGLTGTGVTRSAIFNATAQIAANGTKAFNPIVSTNANPNPSGTITITANPGAPGTSGTSGPVAIA